MDLSNLSNFRTWEEKIYWTFLALSELPHLKSLSNHYPYKDVPHPPNTAVVLNPIEEGLASLVVDTCGDMKSPIYNIPEFNITSFFYDGHILNKGSVVSRLEIGPYFIKRIVADVEDKVNRGIEDVSSGVTFIRKSKGFDYVIYHNGRKLIKVK